MNRFLIVLLLFWLPVTLVLAQQLNTTLTYSVSLPAKKTGRAPVLILLHGYGSNENDLFELAKTMDPRFATFSLRAPNATGDGGYCWYPMDFRGNQQFYYNYADVKQSTAKIISFISNACKTYKLDSTLVFLLGFSQGCIMSFDLALSSPGKIKGILGLSGYLLEESKLIKTNPTQLSKVKIFIAHGNSDNMIKLTQAEKAHAFFSTLKVTDLTFKTYEMPHSISGQELIDIKAWLLKALPPAQKTKVPTTR